MIVLPGRRTVMETGRSMWRKNCECRPGLFHMGVPPRFIVEVEGAVVDLEDRTVRR